MDIKNFLDGNTETVEYQKYFTGQILLIFGAKVSQLLLFGESKKTIIDTQGFGWFHSNFKILFLKKYNFDVPPTKRHQAKRLIITKTRLTKLDPRSVACHLK